MTKQPPERPDSEIEITPQMVEAGATAAYQWAGEFDFERLTPKEMEKFSADIIRAALKAR